MAYLNQLVKFESFKQKMISNQSNILMMLKIYLYNNDNRNYTYPILL